MSGDLTASKLVFVTFRGMGLSEDAYIIIQLVLQNKNSELRDLILSNNPLEDSGLEKILKALKNNPEKKLRVLRLSHCQLESTSGIRLSHMLKEISKRPI